MHINNSTLIFPPQNLSETSRKNAEIANIESTSNIAGNFEIETNQPEDLNEQVKQAINNSLIHQILSAFSRTKQGLFDNYQNFDSENSISTSTKLPATTQKDVTYAVSYSQEETSQRQLTVNNSNFSLEESASRSERLSISTETSITEQQQSDPLILDLDFNGFKFSSTENNIQFDLNADGQLDSISNLIGADAFLAIDLNKNGVIDNGLELFGDVGGAKDGFTDLQKYDQNNDGIINAQDRIFDQLLLLSFSEEGIQQTRQLSDQGIASLNLTSKQLERDYKNANQLTAVADFNDSSGRTGIIGDFLLGIR